MTALQNGCRSVAIGTMFSISSGFGVGLVGIMIWGEVIRRLAEQHNKEFRDLYCTTEEQLNLLKNSLHSILPDFEAFYKRACSSKKINKTIPILETKMQGLNARSPKVPILEVLDAKFVPAY